MKINREQIRYVKCSKATLSKRYLVALKTMNLFTISLYRIFYDGPAVFTLFSSFLVILFSKLFKKCFYVVLASMGVAQDARCHLGILWPLQGYLY